MSIAANKFPGVRAALVSDATAAGMAREHVDANVLVFGGGMTRKFHAHELLHIFLETPFLGAWHQQRVDKTASRWHASGRIMVLERRFADVSAGASRALPGCATTAASARCSALRPSYNVASIVAESPV